LYEIDINIKFLSAGSEELVLDSDGPDGSHHDGPATDQEIWCFPTSEGQAMHIQLIRLVLFPYVDAFAPPF
jgi:hypothetical protein